MHSSRRRLRLLWSASAVLWLGSVTACGDPPGPGDCSGNVDLQVVEGPTPAFSWSPPCEVASLAVFDGGGQVSWAFHTGVGRNALAPTIHYGQLPPEGIETTVPRTLRSGFGYTVRVFRLDREEDQLVLRLAGEAHFRH
jgi:hypothetical protein